jgi:glycosyltransferase involved in cell wall biosynthesis
MSSLPETAPMPGNAGAALPSVAVVIPTHQRPELLRRAIRSVVAQQYAGDLEILVVFDQSEPDVSLVAEFAPVPLRVMPNTREPGLCGGRNTGILATGADFVAFLDDDDEWLPGKLDAQAAALRANPDAEFLATAMLVAFHGAESVRLAGSDRVDYADLLRSRMAMLHSSSFLIRRTALTSGEIGLADETIPRGLYEDWDILLRAARRRPIVHVDEPLVRIEWGRTSFFDEQWETKVAALHWMLDNHPDITTCDVGTGRVLGQLAFAEAALRRRRQAARTAGRALRRNWREPRAYIALAVAAGLATPSRVLQVLHKRGRGV